MSAYLFVFDRDVTSDYVALHNAIKSNSHISNWWHYLNSVYILISSYDADTLTNDIRPHLSSGRYMVIKITKSNYQGYLSKDAWDWIRDNVPYT